MKNSKRDVVVTACGLVSPLGHTMDDFEKGLFSGASGVKSIRGTMVAQDFPVPYAAYIDRSQLPETKTFGKAGYGSDSSVMKSWLMTALATESLLEEIKTPIDIDALVYGTADGVSFEQVSEVLTQKKQNSFEESNYNFKRTRCESSLDIVDEILIRSGFKSIPDEKRICINSACATGNNVLGIAFDGIRSGRWERCLVGGVDARCEPSNFLNFFYLGALTTANVEPEKASCPFSVHRSGFVRGEGAAILMVESRESAEARGAQILAKVTGYGFTSDAYRLTDGRDDGSSVVKAMELALESAGLRPESIDYINAHGTSTPLNDRLESLSIKKVFGSKAYEIPVSSLKSQIGHSTIASSALEAIACLLMLKNQKIAPTLNYQAGDPDCDLDYVAEGTRSKSLQHILSNSFGFGGQNSCIVFSKEQV